MAVTKVINSEEKQFRPVLVDKLVLDSVPTVNSFNSVTSDGVARAIAGASGEVPVVTENDNGKVLKAVYDEGGPAVEWGDAGAAYSAGDGIAISDQNAISVTETVRNGAAAGATAVQPGSLATVATTGAYSDLSGTPTIPTVDQTYDSTSANAQSGTAVAGALASVNQVPASTSSDANKVLTVDSQGVPGWATASGGGRDVFSTYDSSGLFSYPDGSSASVSISHKNGNRIKISPVDYTMYGDFQAIIPYGSGGNYQLMEVRFPPRYISSTDVSKFYLYLGYNTSSTVIPSGYKAAWCTGGETTRYYLVESGATLPNYSSLTGITILYSANNTSVSYSHSATIIVPMPPSADRDYTPDPTKFSKVGDWSSLSKRINIWYLGFVDTSTNTWLSLPTNVIGGTAYIRGGATLRYGLFVESELPASASTDEGKVLTVDSQGAAAWTATTPIQSVQALPANPDPNTLYVIPEA